jgi:hypothetical protein
MMTSYSRLRAGLVLVVLSSISLCMAQDVPNSRMLETSEYRVFEDGVTNRLRVRVNYYVGKDGDPWATSPGQVSIEYGLPAWKPAYEAMFTQLPVGKRWRLGSNYWTNLSTSFDLKFGERVIQAGYYYLVLERSNEDQWNLVVLKPELITQLQLDPWHVNRKDSGQGILVPLKWKKSEETAEKLEIRLKLVDADSKQMVIHVRFGTFHFWSSPIEVSF